MVGISAQEVIERGQELPHIVVLGAGNSMDGVINDNTAINADVASSLLISSLAPRDFIITAGYGPDTGQAFPISEAEVLAGLILSSLEEHDLNPKVYTERTSRDTIANMTGIAPIVEELGIDAMTIVAAKGHADRAALMGRKILGEGMEIVPVYSRTNISTQSKVKEFGLRTLYKGLTLGSREGTRGLERAHKQYRAAVKLPKSVVSGLGLSSRYSG